MVRPSGVTVDADLDTEVLTLTSEPVTRLRALPLSVGLCALLMLMFIPVRQGTLSALLPPGFGIPYTIVFFGVPLALLGTVALHRLSKKEPVERTWRLDAVSLTTEDVSVPWGELRGIRASDDGTTLRLLRDHASALEVPMPEQSLEAVGWLAVYLQRRLDQLAPGEPDELPAALAALRQRELER